MIIDSAKPREDYFLPWTLHDILSQFITGKTNITIRDIKALAEEGKVVVATQEGDLTDLLEDNYTVDHQVTIKATQELQPDQLLVLPEDYRIPQAEAQRLVAHRRDTFIHLDSIAVKRRLMGRDARPGPLTVGQKEVYGWDPGRVLTVACSLLQQHQDRVIDKAILGYRWKSKDGRDHIVPWMNAIEGAELRCVQNIAFYIHGLPILEEEIRTGKTAEGEDLSPQEIRRKELLAGEYRKQVEHYGDLLDDLELREQDMIVQDGKSFDHGTGFVMVVPSRTQPEKWYQFQLRNVPITAPRDKQAYSLVWEVEDGAGPEDKLFRSNRRRSARGRGSTEFVHSPHGIAAYHSQRKMHKRKKKGIHISPFVVPTEMMASCVDRWRYQTIMVGGGDKVSKRHLNETEMGNLIGKTVVVEGFSPCFTTVRGYFRKHNPQEYLVRIR